MGINNENLLVAVKYKGVELQFRNIGEYDLKSIKNADGTQTMQITKVGSTCPKDMLQARVDGDNSCVYLFYQYGGTELDISRIDTSKATSMISMFNGCANLTSLNLSNFGTSKVTNMASMFYNCDSLTSLNLSSFDTSNVTNMTGMFHYCISLTELDISNFNTSNVTNMYAMFAYCSNLRSLDLSNFNTSKVTSMEAMFRECRWLTTLDLSNFDTSNVTNMTGMFHYCISLTELDISNFNTSNVKNMNDMFNTCTHLTSLDLSGFNTSNATSMAGMFSGAGELISIQGTLDLYSATNLVHMFSYTYDLTGATLKNIRKTLQIGSGTSWGHLWELPYLINAVKELWDFSSDTQQTLTIGSANLEKIANTYVKLITPTAEQIEADPYINNKLPCEVCESTDEGAMTLTAYAGLKNWVLA